MESITEMRNVIDMIDIIEFNKYLNEVKRKSELVLLHYDSFMYQL